MATATSNMFLYSLTLQPPTTISHAILGQFSGTKEQQILVASGSRLALLRPEPAQGKVVTLLAHDLFGIIRSLASFRLAGSSKGMFLCVLTSAVDSVAPPKLVRTSRSDHPPG
jgi:splicing factor 3B subunit 3